jgi:hypothetical protein
MRPTGADWQDLQDDIAAWTSIQFPWQTPHSKITHMQAELLELDDDPTDLVEFADCFMLLIDTAQLAGFTMSQVHAAVRDKLEVNRRREWGEPDEHGVSYHVEEAAT